jgi:hypothetical protein
MAAIKRLLVVPTWKSSPGQGPPSRYLFRLHYVARYLMES